MATELVTAKRLAEEFGCSLPHISNMKKNGMPVAQRGSNGKGGRSVDLFDLEVCKAWRSSMMGVGTPEDETKLSEAAATEAGDEEPDYKPSDERIRQLSKLPIMELKKRKLATEITKEEELARTYKIRAEREVGLLVPIEEVRTFISRLYGLVRGRLDSMPASQCNALAIMRDPDEVCQRLEQWVEEVRNDLSEDLGDLLNDES
ncbi:MAG: hypothetical protein E6Q97_10190 [Desulfurellales bacterium]|nr:MAG: hypothetical protein E6Q97_10190 [Desulfurellales bacterium]